MTSGASSGDPAEPAGADTIRIAGGLIAVTCGLLLAWGATGLFFLVPFQSVPQNVGLLATVVAGIATWRGWPSAHGYDNNGNLSSSSAGLAFAYNEKNQTTSVTPPGGTALTMEYADATQDRRTKAGDQRIAYNQLGLTGQGPNNGNPHDTYWMRDDEGILVSQKLPSGAKHYYVFDGLGSVVGLVNSSGSLVASYEYEPYGKQTSSEPSVSNPWRYASGYLDTSTGVMKFGTRYYMPGLARWTQRDPAFGELSSPTTLDPYAYVSCNPVNITDPTGASHTTAECLALQTVSAVTLLFGVVSLFVIPFGTPLFWIATAGSGIIGTVGTIGWLQACLGED